MREFSWEREGATVTKATATVRNVPRILITPHAKQKLDLYIHLCDDEISGLGRVERLGQDFLITDVFIFDQEVTGASTDLDPEAVSRWFTELIREGRDPSEIKLWWHSHCNMGVFWSGTDESTVRKFSNGWMISLVGNKRGEYLVRLDLYEPVQLTVDNLDLQIHWPEDSALKAEVEKEIREKVRRRVPIVTGFQNGYGEHDFFARKGRRGRKRR